MCFHARVCVCMRTYAYACVCAYMYMEASGYLSIVQNAHAARPTAPPPLAPASAATLKISRCKSIFFNYKTLLATSPLWPRGPTVPRPFSHYTSTFPVQIHFPITSPLSHYKSTLLKAELLKKNIGREAADIEHTSPLLRYKSTFPFLVHSLTTNPFSHYKSTFPLQVHFIKSGVVKNKIWPRSGRY